MAKKKKYKSSRSTPSVSPSSSTDLASEYKPVSIPRRAMEDDAFNPDYTAIIMDLKRIGTLAGIFFAVLIVLAFIL